MNPAPDADGLSVRDLACVRGDRLVFRGVSFDLAPGQCLRLVGPNGSGKSSLLRLLAGLGAPEAGSIRLPPARDGRAAALHVGHAEAVKPWLGVAENLVFWAQLYGARGPVEPALAALGLLPLAALSARYLSAGQKRRLALARLAAIPARLWLLDEPTVGLDAASVATVERLIAAHAGAGGLAIIATHVPVALPGEVTLDLGAPGARAA
jgi:heme exporter protein A